MQCIQEVTKRNPYMNPPNTTQVQCSHDAIDGKRYCKQHLAMIQNRRERAIVKQELRSRKV